MDVINDRIVDIGLNALGYLIAGGLGMLLHTVIQQRRLRSAAARKEVTAAEGSEFKTAAPGNTGKDIEFVSFRAETPEVTTMAANATSHTNSPHRNRREIIRLAREMLEAGTAGEKIRKTLPISQSELALLKNVSRN